MRPRLLETVYFQFTVFYYFRMSWILICLSLLSIVSSSLGNFRYYNDNLLLTERAQKQQRATVERGEHPIDVKIETPDPNNLASLNKSTAEVNFDEDSEVEKNQLATLLDAYMHSLNQGNNIEDAKLHNVSESFLQLLRQYKELSGAVLQDNDIASTLASFLKEASASSTFPAFLQIHLPKRHPALHALDAEEVNKLPNLPNYERNNLQSQDP